MTHETITITSAKTEAIQASMGAFSVVPSKEITADLLKSFISYIDGTEATVKTYKKSLAVFSKWIQEKGIKHPTALDLMQYKKDLEEEHKPTTVSSYLTAVKQFYKWYACMGYGADIAYLVKGEKLTHEFRKDYLTEDQTKELLSCFDTSTLEGARDYAITRLCITCGLRTIEVSRANIGDIATRANGRVLYVWGKGRTDKAEWVDLGYKTEKAIRDYLALRGITDAEAKADEPLFASISDRCQGQRLTADSVSRIIRKALKKCNLKTPRITAHSLRHTSAVMSIEYGATLEETMMHMRHKDMATTEIYTHDLEKAKYRTSSKIDDEL